MARFRGHLRMKLAVSAAVLLAGVLLTPAVRASDSRPCTTSPPDGGEWTQLAGSEMGSGAQPAEDEITPATVGSLQFQWATPTGGYQSIPVVAGNCVYSTGDGALQAFSIDDGSIVWAGPKGSLPASSFQPFAPAVADGRVHVGFDNGLAPAAASFEADTGAELWRSDPVTFDYPAWQLASAAVYDGVQLLATTGPDFDPKARPGFAMIDAATGEVLKKRTTIPEEDLDAGYAGGGIWGTPSVDPQTGFAYVGTSNPYTKTYEHPYDNAVVKIDMRRSSPTFGEVVGSYKGDPDNVLGDPLYDQPACPALSPYVGGHGFASPCGQMDIDFGNGPTMWRLPDGTTALAIIQKSGVIHAVRGDTMEPLWKTLVGSNAELSLTGGNHGAAANDGSRMYVMANPGVLHAVDLRTGAIAWSAPLAEPIASRNVAVAGGVVFTLDSVGVHGFDAATGAPLWVAVGAANGLMCNGESGGVSVARHTVVVNCGGTIAAYRLAGAALADAQVRRHR